MTRADNHTNEPEMLDIYACTNLQWKLSYTYLRYYNLGLFSSSTKATTVVHIVKRQLIYTFPNA